MAGDIRAGIAPAFYNRGIVDESSARIQVTPRQTEVYVDGYLAGVVDDFDGFAQRLRVAPGEHVIELYLDGHKTIAQTILFAPGQSYRIRHAMEPLAAGEASARASGAEARRAAPAATRRSMRSASRSAAGMRRRRSARRTARRSPSACSLAMRRS